MSASAQTFQTGDLIFAWSVPSVIGTTFGSVDWYTGSGGFRRSIATYADNPAVGLIFGHDGRLYATRPYTVPSGIIVFDTSGNPSGSFGPAIAIPQAITRDAAGNLFVEDAFGVEKIDPSGNRIATLNAPGGNMDLSHDQCTLMVVPPLTRSVRRYDVCRDTALSDLTTNTPGSSAWDIRILPDQTLLI